MNQDNSNNQQQFGTQSISQLEIRDSDHVIVKQIQILQIAADEIKKREFIKSSPYKGLKKFEPGDKDLFFGREQLLKDLVNDLVEQSLILLLGASGSGKSSVVRAGLIPWFTRKYGANSVFILTPDQDPFESLYASLLANDFSQNRVQFIRESKADTLPIVVNKLKPKNAHWLIFIDQFEELFTISLEKKRKPFLESLIRLHKQQDKSVKLIIAMRSDFLDKFTPYPSFGKLTEKRIRLMTDMDEYELQLAIEQPAMKHGVVFETGLVKEIIQGVQGQPGYLPLLQYTLNLLWETEQQNSNLQDRTLKTSIYRSLGGVSGTLKKRVDDIYAQLKQEGKGKIVKQIFLRLVDIASMEESGNKPVRRRAYRSEFTEDKQNPLQELIDQNLLVSNDATCSRQPTVEISHETLLSSWELLKNWIKEEHEVIALRNRLVEDMKNWKKTKAKEELWSGSRLERILELRQENAFAVLGGLKAEESHFIDVSLAWREHRRQRAILGLASFSAVALILTGVAGLGWWRSAIKELNAIQGKSEALFASKREFDALIESIRAAQKVKRTFGVDPDIQIDVVNALQQAINFTRERNRLEGHEDRVFGVAFSPDGQTIATASADKTVKLWSRDGKELQTLEGHEDRVLSVSFSPNGQTIATTSEDKTVKLWSRDGKELQTLEGHEKRVWSVSFSPDGQTIATASADNTVKLWSRDGKELQTLTGFDAGLLSVSFSPDGQIIAAASYDSTVKLWSRDGKELQTLRGHEQGVWSVSFSPDGQTIATASADKTVKLWSRDGKELQTLRGHTHTVTSVIFSPNGEFIATASADTKAKLWSRSGKELQTFHGHDNWIWSISFSPDSQTIATASYDKTAKLWSWKSKYTKVLTGHKNIVSSISFSPDSQTIATAGWDNTVKLWSQDGKELQTLRGHDDRVLSVSFSPDSQTIATASYDKTAKLWSQDGKEIQTLEGHKDAIIHISFSPDSQTIATASWDKTAKLWSRDGKEIQTLEGHDDSFSGISFSPDSQTIATSSWDNTVKLWSRDGKEIQTLEGHEDRVLSVSFSPDGQIIVTASRDQTAKLWSRDGKELQTLRGHDDIVYYASFSLDGQTIATASADNTVKLWSRDGKELQTLRGHNDDVYHVSFSSDGKTIATASSDYTAILWNFNSKDLDEIMVYACGLVRNYLKNNSNAKEDRTLCDGIGNQKYSRS